MSLFIERLTPDGRPVAPTLDDMREFLALADEGSEVENRVALLELVLVEDVPGDWHGRLGRDFFSEAAIQDAAADFGLVARPCVRQVFRIDGEELVYETTPSDADWMELRDVFWGEANPRTYGPYRALAGKAVDRYEVEIVIRCGGEAAALDPIYAGLVRIV